MFHLCLCVCRDTVREEISHRVREVKTINKCLKLAREHGTSCAPSFGDPIPFMDKGYFVGRQHDVGSTALLRGNDPVPDFAAQSTSWYYYVRPSTALPSTSPADFFFLISHNESRIFWNISI